MKRIAGLVALAASVCVTCFGAALFTPVTALSFSPDGSFLLASARRAVTVRSVPEGKIREALPCEFAKLTAIVFSPNGRFLAVGGGTPGESGGVQLFDWKEGKRAMELHNFDDLVSGVAFAPDNSRLAVASADHLVQVFSLDPARRETKLDFTLTDHSGPVLAVAFSPDGKLLVSASADRSLKVWGASRGTLLRTFNHHTAAVQTVSIRPQFEGNSGSWFCASGSDDRTVRIWQPEIGRMVRIVREHEGTILALAYSRDGRRLFSAGSEGVIRVIDGDSDTILQKCKAHDDWIYSLALSPDGRTLATGDWQGKIKLWDLSSDVIRPIRQSL